MSGRMGKRALVKRLDTARIETALAEAEKRTSGELRVSVAPLFWGDVRREAERAFDRLGMTRTRDRNAVLFFIVPSRRRFVVLGDVGIHEKVGQAFWDRVAARMSGRFREDDFTGGLVAGIEAAAAELEAHFPWREGDVNELSDQVDFGPEKPEA